MHLCVSFGASCLWVLPKRFSVDLFKWEVPNQSDSKQSLFVHTSISLSLSFSLSLFLSLSLYLSLSLSIYIYTYLYVYIYIHAPRPCPCLGPRPSPFDAPFNPKPIMGPCRRLRLPIPCQVCPILNQPQSRGWVKLQSAHPHVPPLVSR